jgi:hypothetical protein
MYLSEELQSKWGPVLDHEDLESISDPHKRACTAILLENQETALREAAASGSGQFLTEASPMNAIGSTGGASDTGAIDTFDPVLISLVRRAMPNLIAYDICGVQPMTGPTGLIFAMRAQYTDSDTTAGAAGGNEALFNEANTAFSATAQDGNLPADSEHSGGDSLLPAARTANGMTTSFAESLGGVPGTDDFAEMAFTIDKVTVTALSRALKAEYTVELAQDLKAVHGLDAETELANILSAEILSEINREIVRTINKTATSGAATGTAAAGSFDLDVDANGRWSVERFKGLMFQLEREANKIAKETRRGKGNIIICSSDVASALSMAGSLDHAPALKDNLNVDDTGNTFAGVLNGRFKVYIDPYFVGSGGRDYVTVGYKGSSAYDAGLFYCPYVPLQMVRAVGENTFQPKIGFKTRYGLVANPFATSDGDGVVTTNMGTVVAEANKNLYYRSVAVLNLM